MGRNVEKGLSIGQCWEHILDLLETGHELATPDRDTHLGASLKDHDICTRLGGEPCGGAPRWAGTDHEDIDLCRLNQ